MSWSATTRSLYVRVRLLGKRKRDEWWNGMMFVKQKREKRHKKMRVKKNQWNITIFSQEKQAKVRRAWVEFCMEKYWDVTLSDQWSRLVTQNVDQVAVSFTILCNEPPDSQVKEIYSPFFSPSLQFSDDSLKNDAHIMWCNLQHCNTRLTVCLFPSSLLMEISFHPLLLNIRPIDWLEWKSISQ